MEAEADDKSTREFHRRGVEKLVAGLDINEVSLQLAGAQLSLGDTGIRYRRMELHRMPYGDQNDSMGIQPAMAGTLELLTDSRIVGHGTANQPELELGHVGAKGRRIALVAEEKGELDDVVETIKGRRVALMNPPFVARTKLGERFSEIERSRILQRIDGIQEFLEKTDPTMQGITDRNSTQPLYVALALKAIDKKRGVIGMIVPTAALMAPSGWDQRRIIAEDLHVRWVITCHEPGNTHMSHTTGINESLVIGTKDRSRVQEGSVFVSLDRWPECETDAIAVCNAIASGEEIPNGEQMVVSQEMMEHGDWSACGYRNGRLSAIVAELNERKELIELREWKDRGSIGVHATGQSLRGSFRKAQKGENHTLAIVKSKAGAGRNAQCYLKAQPDEIWTAKNRNAAERRLEQMQQKSGHLLVTAGQRTDSGRLSAVYAEHATVGNAWIPVTGLNKEEAKAMVVWLNSTIGRLLLLRVRGKTLTFPVYSAQEIRDLRVPAREHQGWVERLVKVYEETKSMEVPRYDAGDCEVRRQWDKAVGRELDKMGCSVDIDRLRYWLNLEPAITGRLYWD